MNRNTLLLKNEIKNILIEIIYLYENKNNILIN